MIRIEFNVFKQIAIGIYWDKNYADEYVIGIDILCFNVFIAFKPRFKP